VSACCVGYIGLNIVFRTIYHLYHERLDANQNRSKLKSKNRVKYNSCPHMMVITTMDRESAAKRAVMEKNEYYNM